jgi:hypothetical protein
MKKILLIASILFLFVGCAGKNTIPPGVLPQKKMQAILWDLMRADQFLNEYVLNKDSSLNKKTESQKYYQQIFAIHKISREEFQYSFSFYKMHPVLFKPILDSISAPPKAIPQQTLAPIEIKDTVSFQKDTFVPGASTKPPDTNRVRKKIKKLPIPIN